MRNSDGQSIAGVPDPARRRVRMNEDQLKGRAKKVTGKAEETAGRILDDKKKETKGAFKKNIGKVQAWFGDLKNDLKKK
jgi:uncharacterized protein YjbJ (UPF0337 family)